MTLYYDDTEFVRIINLYKKRENWEDILEEAADNVLDFIIMDAMDLAVGGVAEEISGYVGTSGNSVTIELECSHPAAAMFEYGGYSSFPPWDEVGGVLPFPVARAIEENQPFSQPQPFLRPAFSNNVGLIESEVVSVARQMSD